jgi:hypothetical protein
MQKQTMRAPGNSGGALVNLSLESAAQPHNGAERNVILTINPPSAVQRIEARKKR